VTLTGHGEPPRTGAPAEAGGWPSARLAAAILAPVGLNPFRPRQRSIADYLMVAGAVVVCVALLVWAAFG
jgi:hypothetical protein